MDTISNRDFLKAGDWRKFAGAQTDQQKGVDHPPTQKPYPKGAMLIDLVSPKEFTIGNVPLIDAINNRSSRRSYLDKPLSLEELSFLLWSTQGIKRTTDNGVTSFRTVPSAGSRHPVETYLLIKNVTSLSPGLYRYLPDEHKLLPIRSEPSLPTKLAQACCGQTFVATAAVTFIWTAIPYRTEWRYAIFSHKIIALDAGHICQNLYLTVEAIKAGTCAIGAYLQDEVDSIIGVDGKDEFTVYIAPVGKIR
ncbi:MAG: SagB/ThcOx family dehydrogenase [Anaerohalosphaera sp.]|nr:SagB/ThcOx family dehydrogenase [Anaerohalosphaera sp.]